MVGIDIVKISRIRELLIKFNHKFINKFFHSAEVLQSKKYGLNIEMLYRYFAKRFAAKEAYIKAVGSSKGIKMSEIAILNDANGKPVLHINDQEVKNSSVSLSDDGDYVIAAVILINF